MRITTAGEKLIRNLKQLGFVGSLETIIFPSSACWERGGVFGIRGGDEDLTRLN